MASPDPCPASALEREFGIAGRDGEGVKSVSTASPYISIPRIHCLLPEKSGQGSQRGQWKGPGLWEHMKTSQSASP